MSKVYRVLALFAILAMLVAGCVAPAAPAPAAEAPAAEAPAAEEPAAAEQPAAEEPAAMAGGEFHGAYPYQVPPTGHLNTYVTAGIPQGLGPYFDLLMLPGARYYWGDGSYMPLAAESWEFQPPDKFVVKVRQGMKWSNGTDFTAKDWVTTWNVGRLFKWTIFNYVDKVTAVDDYTVEFLMHTPSTVVERYVLNERIRDTSTYGALADEAIAMVDAGTTEGDEWSALVQKATDFRPETLNVSGPFNLDVPNITEAQLSLLKNPNSYLAETIKFDKIVLYNGETPTVTPLVLAGDVDYATHGFPMATEKQYQDLGLRITRAPTYSGPSIYFNHDIAPFDKVEFRQAVAFAIDRQQNGTVSLGESGKAMTYITGFSDLLLPLWLTEAETAELTVYQYDAAKAEELLTGIGFTKGADGFWADDTGTTLDLELIFPAEFADWSAAAENLTEQLNNFGIKTTARGVNFQQITAEVNQGNFEIAIQGWGVGNPHPYFGYQTVLFSRNYIAATEGKGINFPMTQTIDGAEVDLEAAIVHPLKGWTSAVKANVVTIAKAFQPTAAGHPAVGALRQQPAVRCLGHRRATTT